MGKELVREVNAHGSQRNRWLITLRTVMAQPNLRRILLAFCVFGVAEMATWITLLVWAFDRGGTAATGFIALGQLVPASLTAPLASVMTDRIPRLPALRLGYFIQAATHLAVAAALFANAPFWLVLIAAAVSASSLTLTRPVHHALIPELSRSPEELTAGNAVSTAIEGLADFIGPALAGLLLLAGSPGWVFVVMGGATVLAATGVRGFTIYQVSKDTVPYWAKAAEGVQAVVRNPAAVSLTTIMTGQFIIIGALDVLAVTLAFTVLKTGPAGPGIINSAIGMGALLGAGTALVMVGRRRLAPALAAGLLGVSVSLALVATTSNFTLSIMLFALVGVGRSTVDVAARTLLQRNMLPRLLARTFGVQEALMMAGTALGAALGPILVVLAGPQGAFVATAALLPTIGLICWRQVHSFDTTGPPDEALWILKPVQMFSILPLPQLEQLASALELLPSFDDGHVLIRQGDEAQDCYVIVKGRVAIERDGVRIAELGPGQIVGEIALLRVVPRTATARAIGTVQVAALGREPFLLAVTGCRRTYQLANEGVQQRLDQLDPTTESLW